MITIEQLTNLRDALAARWADLLIVKRKYAHRRTAERDAALKAAHAAHAEATAAYMEALAAHHADRVL